MVFSLEGMIMTWFLKTELKSKSKIESLCFVISGEHIWSGHKWCVSWLMCYLCWSWCGPLPWTRPMRATYITQSPDTCIVVSIPVVIGTRTAWCVGIVSTTRARSLVLKALALRENGCQNLLALRNSHLPTPGKRPEISACPHIKRSFPLQ